MLGKFLKARASKRQNNAVNHGEKLITQVLEGAVDPTTESHVQRPNDAVDRSAEALVLREAIVTGGVGAAAVFFTDRKYGFTDRESLHSDLLELHAGTPDQLQVASEVIVKEYLAGVYGTNQL